jgi:hypothetical protein
MQAKPEPLSPQGTIVMPPKGWRRSPCSSITVPNRESLEHAFGDAAIFVHIA